MCYTDSICGELFKIYPCGPCVCTNYRHLSLLFLTSPLVEKTLEEKKCEVGYVMLEEKRERKGRVREWTEIEAKEAAL